MLTQESINKIAQLLKIKTEDLQSALTSTEETAIEIPEVQTFTKVELETRDAAKKGNGYADGKKAGVEMAVKEVKEELGLEFEGKDIKTLIEHHGKKILADAKVTPKETEEVISNLRRTVTDMEAKLSAKENEFKAVELKTKVLSLLPDNAKGLNKEETLSVLKANGYDFNEEDGKLVVLKNGAKMLDDKLQTPIEATEAINSIYTEREWMPKQGAQGRGGSSSSPNLTSTKLSEVEKEWKAAGKSTQGEEFSAHVTALSKDPNFDING